MIYNVSLELKLHDNPEYVKEVKVKNLLDHEAAQFVRLVLENFPPDVLSSVFVVQYKDDDECDET